MAPRPLALLLAALALPLAAPECSPPPRPPALVFSTPGDGESVARSAWVVLHFAGPVPASARNAAFLVCDGALVETEGSLPDGDTLALDPVGGLPPGGACEVVIDTTVGPARVAFGVDPVGAPVELVYDRRDRNVPLPFPDDSFLVPDATRPTGFRPVVIPPDRPGTAVGLVTVLASVAEQADGWSPIGAIGIEFGAAPDLDTLPTDPALSLDPLSPVALLDLTPGSPEFGQRVPFQLTPRTDAIPGAPVAHTAVIHAQKPLEPEGTYGLVVANRVRAASGEPLSRSAFFELVAGPPLGGEAPEVTRARPLADEVIDAAEALSPVPIQREDVVVAVRLSVRSTDHFADDPLGLRATLPGTPPNVTITSVEPDFDPDVAALVTGTFDAPLWRAGAFLTRDASGAPAPSGTLTVPFVLALPAAAATEGMAPVLMYQHGNPGSAEGEVPGSARSWMGAQGFAVGGFTDVLNRTYASVEEQQLAIFGVVLAAGEPPDFYLQVYGEQMAFVRALQSLDQLDLLPLGAPDGVPDLDPSILVYEGISYGSVHGQAFLAYEPDIAAAGEVVGAARLAELLEYQDRTTPTGGARFLVETLPSLLTGVRMPDIWMGLALFAINYDRQDPHNHARFLYREPVMVDGTTQKASILVVEGIEDTFTTNNQTRSLAWQLGGIPQLAGATTVQPVPGLPQQAGPIQGNVDAGTTAAFVQFAPAGIPGISPAPGCSGQFEGHFCAQSSPASRGLRASFYQSALVGVPVIDD